MSRAVLVSLALTAFGLIALALAPLTYHAFFCRLCRSMRKMRSAR